VRVQSHAALDRFNDKLWRLATYVLRDNADFDDQAFSFVLRLHPFQGEVIHEGPYRLTRHSDDTNVFRVGHPLAQKLIELAEHESTPTAEVRFDYNGSGKNIAILRPLVGGSGWLTCQRMMLRALQSEDSIVFSALSDGRRNPRQRPVPPAVRPSGHRRRGGEPAADVDQALRDEAWRTFDQAGRALEREKEQLLDDIERRLTASIDRVPLFTLRWSVT
jgi:hypothetical protein